MTRDERIAFDYTVVGLNRAGSGVYASRLIEAAHPLLGDRLTLVASRFAAPRGQTPTLRDRAFTLIRDLYWAQYAVVQRAEQQGARLLHVPMVLGPIRSRLPLVLTMHDLAVLRFPEQFSPWFRYYARAVLPRIAKTLRHVITGSLVSKIDITERLGIAEERVTIIPYGVGAEFIPVASTSERAQRVRRRYGLPDAFALTVGSLEPRKNLVRLLRAIHQLRQRHDVPPLRLVHVGPPGWLAADVPAVMSDLRLNDIVQFIGYVPAEDLPVLYSLSRVMVYPSLFEGFGFPVIEAMACGTPVVTSDVSSLPEVAGDAALLVDPLSVDAIADGLCRLWTDDALRQRMRDRGTKRASGFSWHRAATETVALYDRVLAAQ